MEMNFPHLENGLPRTQAQADCRALLSRAISRQTNSRTAEIVRAASPDIKTASLWNCTLQQRMQFFANSNQPIIPETTPYGSFFPGTSTNLSTCAIYDQAVYQDGLANGKVDGVKIILSDNLALKPGHEN
jgi:hypothetical protein